MLVTYLWDLLNNRDRWVFLGMEIFAPSVLGVREIFARSLVSLGARNSWKPVGEGAPVAFWKRDDHRGGPGLAEAGGTDAGDPEAGTPKGGRCGSGSLAARITDWRIPNVWIPNSRILCGSDLGLEDPECADSEIADPGIADPAMEMPDCWDPDWRVQIAGSWIRGTGIPDPEMRILSGGS